MPRRRSLKYLFKRAKKFTKKARSSSKAGETKFRLRDKVNIGKESILEANVQGWLRGYGGWKTKSQQKLYKNIIETNVDYFDRHRKIRRARIPARAQAELYSSAILDAEHLKKTSNLSNAEYKRILKRSIKNSVKRYLKEAKIK